MSEIDVSKCEFITKHDDCRICNGKSLRLYCRDNTDCYYKQLQQLKEENEELKYKLSDTERRLVELSKANTHNLVLLQRHNKCLDEIEGKVKKLCKRCALDFKMEDVNSIPNEEYCNDTVCYSILQLIKQAKEGRND